MLFKFPKKKITLDCFTSDAEVYDNCKINYGKSFFPDWFKKTKPFIGRDGVQPTIKHCYGLQEFYRSAVIIPSWFSLSLMVKKDGDNKLVYEWAASGPGLREMPHDYEQYDKFATTERNFKIRSPWFFRTKEDIKWVWSQPTWSNKDIYDTMTLLPAVVPYNNVFETNISWMIQDPKDTVRQLHIKPLTPLVAIHAMTEKQVEIKNHLISKEDLERQFNTSSRFFMFDGGPKQKETSIFHHDKKKFYLQVDFNNKGVKSYDHTKK